MIEHIHKHIISELGQNTRTDTIFILTAIILNLISLAVNSGFVEKSRTETTYLIVMFILLGPDESDDKAATICSGEAGALLTKMLAAINVSINDVYVKNDMYHH